MSLYLLSLCLFSASVFLSLHPSFSSFFFEKLENTTESEAYTEKIKAMLKIQNSQFFSHSVLTPDTARVSLKVKGHLLNILATLKCQMSHSFVQYISLTS